MKKVLSLVLCLAMVFSLSVTAFATETTPTGNYGSGTKVTYDGTATEAYEVTVPASLTPVAGSNSGTVTVSGKWASDRVVKVDADATVTLINSINSSDTKDLHIEFTPIAKEGSNTVAITTEDTGASSTVSVEAITGALFGTWEGTFNYDVSIDDAN